jgi:hypothetical protein
LTIIANVKTESNQCLPKTTQLVDSSFVVGGLTTMDAQLSPTGREPVGAKRVLWKNPVAAEYANDDFA